MVKKLLLGDEAIAQGAIDAGLSGVYAYPGTPSTEITEYIQNSPIAKERGIHSRWCTNEKTAMEAALGVSFAGGRALVCMKHVGMNVAADAFVNSAVTGVNGGLVVLVADDPSMHSSQNEQDTRFYGKFAMVPIFEPSTQQEAYDMMDRAYELSEKFKIPVLMRVVTRLAHSRADVCIASEPRSVHRLTPDNNPSQWVLVPANARRCYLSLLDKQKDIAQAAADSVFSAYRPAATSTASAAHTDYADADAKATKGVIACGIAWNYVMEADSAESRFNVLKLSQYPIPTEAVRKLATQSSEIIVIEDGQPFVEEQIKGILSADYSVRGRLTGDLPRTGELNPDNVKKALGYSGKQVFAAASSVVARPPALCQGCGHRDVYTALNEVVKEFPEARVFSDIGCYTLGVLPPFRAIDSCVDMGASITMAKGAADTGLYPAIAVIGDSTFTHSGMTGLLDAVNDKSDITVIISDNLTTAMTGGQDSAGTSRLEAICIGLGVEPDHLHIVVPLPANIPQITRIIREEIGYHGVSVIIPRRECIQVAARHARQKKAASTAKKR